MQQRRRRAWLALQFNVRVGAGMQLAGIGVEHQAAGRGWLDILKRPGAVACWHAVMCTARQHDARERCACVESNQGWRARWWSLHRYRCFYWAHSRQHVFCEYATGQESVLSWLLFDKKSHVAAAHNKI
ncbi:hypothetical protein XALC_1247 [Xanthomonas albilineans GPE PC73]|uniref:Uncharacterized protein n=1 Tax=Xanthomonas albilineans (strain GPE PC73 / CFBP 7063) TaxID=380358 RepID=D2UA27_XANAP|nr:hypothetical protein XALC_1247 [Xanthomonas albilineans GPE PC73]